MTLSPVNANPLMGALLCCSLALPIAAADAACETPMPATLPIDSPPAGLSATDAAYLGMWSGEFRNRYTGTVCMRLAVQHIESDGTVTLTWATGEFWVSFHPNSGTDGRGEAPALTKAYSRDYVGHLDKDGLHFTTARGNKATVRAEGKDKLAITIVNLSGPVTEGGFAREAQK
jgi:hypothetical protein